MSKPKTTQMHGEQIPVLRAGTDVVVTRTITAVTVIDENRTVDVPVHTTGRVSDVRPHGRGVQYSVDIGGPHNVWVAGRYVKKQAKPRASRKKAA